MTTNDVPLIHDVERWPFKAVLPSLAILPVKHFTSHSDINEGGFLIAVDGVVLPQVFVGTAEMDLSQDEREDSGSPTLRYELLDLLRVAAKFDGGVLDYGGVHDIILDGWRPEG